MKFCETCGNLLKVHVENEGRFLYCKTCNKKTPLTEDMTIESPNDPKSKEILIMPDNEQPFPVTTTLCPKCDMVREVYWTMQQTRGGDEPPTRFYHCKTCNWRWRDYG